MRNISVNAYLLPLIVLAPLVANTAAVVDAVLLNQLLAVGLSGGVVAAIDRESEGLHGQGLSHAGVVVALLALAAAVAGQRWQSNQVPVDLAGLLAALFVFLRAARADPAATEWKIGMVWGWALAGAICVPIALMQYAGVERWVHEVGLHVIAASSSAGRAIGNMRQPNHLATALVCAMVWTAWLAQTQRLRPAVASAWIWAMVFAVALSASRTGALSLGVLVLWALIDRRLPRPLRWALGLTPLVYGVFWLGLVEWAASQQGHYYGLDRLQSAGDPSSSRVAIWKNALALIAQHPWAGVGWGNFNFAWTFTRFPDRPIAFFDHTHNLPLQLAVEIGLPATAVVLGLFGCALWRARGAWWGDGLDDAAQRQSPARAAFVMLVVLGVHSMLEYPLWYAYFLLPAAWALGTFIGAAPARAGAAPSAPRLHAAGDFALRALLVAGGLAMVIGSIYALWDHRRIERIFEATPGAAPLAERIAEGQRSRLFGHHADYAAVTNEPRDQRLETFRRPLLQLVDVRLLIAYIEALKAAGDDARALYAAQRLREFRRDDAQAYFKDCDSPTPLFHCERTPVTGLTWKDMLPP